MFENNLLRKALWLNVYVAEDGAELPAKFEPFPPDLLGRPVEEIDQFVYEKVSKKNINTYKCKKVSRNFSKFFSSFTNRTHLGSDNNSFRFKKFDLWSKILLKS